MFILEKTCSALIYSDWCYVMSSRVVYAPHVSTYGHQQHRLVRTLSDVKTVYGAKKVGDPCSKI